MYLPKMAIFNRWALDIISHQIAGGGGGGVSVMFL